MVPLHLTTIVLLSTLLHLTPPTHADDPPTSNLLFDQERLLEESLFENDSLFAANIGINNPDFQHLLSHDPSVFGLGLSNATFQKDLDHNGGYKVAWRARPLWHFARYLKHPTCYPESAITDEKQTPPAGLQNWPKTEGGCPNPGAGGWGNPFPTYYTISRCSDDEVRVVYNLFFRKDGWSGAGHQLDWERVFVVWTRSGDEWITTDIAYGYHKKYNKYKWSDIWTTDIDDRDKVPDDGVNRKMPKAYVSWGKHAMFREKCGGPHGYCCCGLGDIFSENLPWAQRRDDFYYSAQEGYLLNAGRETKLGKQIAGFIWGGGSYPGLVQDTVCTK